MLAFAELVLPDGSLDGRKIRLTPIGPDLAISVDLDGGGAGFIPIATVGSAAGRSLDEVFANAFGYAPG